MKKGLKQSGWETKTFGEVLEIRNGRNQREVESADGEFPIYGSAGNVMGMATDYICEAGTTIIGRKGNINSPIYSDTRFWNVDTAFGLAAKAGMDSRFLYFFCLSYDFSAHNRGTTIPSLVKSELLNIPIPVPPLAEQQRIVGLLYEAFEGLATAKANAEKNLQNARALFESHLQSVFTQRGPGWVEKSLGDVCEFENGDRGKNYPNRNEYVETGIPWINTGHIQPDGTLSMEEMNFITRQKFDSLRSGKIHPGDLVYCLRGATLGKTALVDPLTEGAVASSLVILRPSSLLDRRFLYFFLTSPAGQGLIRGFENGAAQPNLGAKSVAKYPISFPKLPEQREIADSLIELREETQRLARLYERKHAALEALKKSLLHQAFTGEL